MTDETEQLKPEKGPDLYDALGVDRGATLEDVKRHWRKWAFDNHPDRGGDGEEFKRRAAAAEILTDKDRRERYDGSGATRPDPDKVRLSVIAITQQIILSIINSEQGDDDLESISVTARVLELLNEKGHAFAEQWRILKRRKKRTEKLAKRLQKRQSEEETDVIASILSSALQDGVRNEFHLREQEQIHFAVVELWMNYDYVIDWGDVNPFDEATLRRLGGRSQRRLARPPVRPDDPTGA